MHQLCSRPSTRTRCRLWPAARDCVQIRSNRLGQELLTGQAQRRLISAADAQQKWSNDRVAGPRRLVQPQRALSMKSATGLRGCGGATLPAQSFSPDRSFAGAFNRRICCCHSLRRHRTGKMRTEPPDASAARLGITNTTKSSRRRHVDCGRAANFPEPVAQTSN